MEIVPFVAHTVVQRDEEAPSIATLSVLKLNWLCQKVYAFVPFKYKEIIKLVLGHFHRARGLRKQMPLTVCVAVFQTAQVWQLSSSQCFFERKMELSFSQEDIKQ